MRQRYQKWKTGWLMSSRYIWNVIDLKIIMIRLWWITLSRAQRPNKDERWFLWAFMDFFKSTNWMRLQFVYFTSRRDKRIYMKAQSALNQDFVYFLINKQLMENCFFFPKAKESNFLPSINLVDKCGRPAVWSVPASWDDWGLHDMNDLLSSSDWFWQSTLSYRGLNIGRFMIKIK